MARLHTEHATCAPWLFVTAVVAQRRSAVARRATRAMPIVAAVPRLKLMSSDSSSHLRCTTFGVLIAGSRV